MIIVYFEIVDRAFFYFILFFYLKSRKNQAFISNFTGVISTFICDWLQFNLKLLFFALNADLTCPLCICFTLKHFQQSRENSSSLSWLSWPNIGKVEQIRINPTVMIYTHVQDLVIYALK